MSRRLAGAVGACAVGLTCAAVAARGQPTTVPASAPATSPATSPATPPATAPATQPVNLSTPKDALRALATGLAGGDADALRQVVLPGNPTEAKMVDAMAGMAAALADLHRAAAAAFGEVAAGRFTGNSGAQLAESLARIEQAQVVPSADGNAAAVRYPGAKEAADFALARVDGRWRVPAVQFCKGADGPALERAVDETNVQAAVVRELARELSAGKFRTADAASDAWHSKMMQALGGTKQPGGPATMPVATRPAGG